MPNIIAVDFYRTGDLIEVVRVMNEFGLVTYLDPADDAARAEYVLAKLALWGYEA